MGSFDQISHAWLLAHAPMDKAILKQWLEAGYIEKQALHPTKAGTPQGGIISPVLANLALDGLEGELRKRFRHRDNSKPSTGVNYVRYADDFIITARSPEQLEEIREFTQGFMAGRGLQLSPEKTKITHIADGFDFLGQNVRRYKDKLIIKPAQKNIKAYLQKVRTTIKTSYSLTSGELIQELNPIIRGWANYHRHVCSKATYRETDYLIFKALWAWARRRHPKKNAHWLRKKYFHTHGTRTWTFSGEITGKNGKTKMGHLLYAAHTLIRRHAKIQGNANPFDPEWEMYLEKRILTRMKDKLHPKLFALWQSQQGKCPACQQIITLEDGWHTHHVVWRSKGGGDQLSNLQTLHPACHWQVHAKRLKL